MMTQESADKDITTTRHIISNFPRSQHRHVIIHYGMRISLMISIPKPRWNFLRADWKAFTDDLDHVIQFIPARLNSYERFAKAVIAAAKRPIPRGYRNQYIPGWNVRCDELYEEYNSSHRNETAANILQELNDQRNGKKLLQPPILPIQAEKLGIY
jgi:hypothetical protein